MYLAEHNQELETGGWVGNSPNVIHQHYKGLYKEADAHEFWTITPGTVKSEIVKFAVERAA